MLRPIFSRNTISPETAGAYLPSETRSEKDALKRKNAAIQLIDAIERVAFFADTATKQYESGEITLFEVFYDAYLRRKAGLGNIALIEGPTGTGKTFTANHFAAYIIAKNLYDRHWLKEACEARYEGASEPPITSGSTIFMFTTPQNMQIDFSNKVYHQQMLSGAKSINAPLTESNLNLYLERAGIPVVRLMADHLLKDPFEPLGIYQTVMDMLFPQDSGGTNTNRRPYRYLYPPKQVDASAQLLLKEISRYAQQRLDALEACMEHKSRKEISKLEKTKEQLKAMLQRLSLGSIVVTCQKIKEKTHSFLYDPHQPNNEAAKEEICLLIEEGLITPLHKATLIALESLGNTPLTASAPATDPKADAHFERLRRDLHPMHVIQENSTNAANGIVFTTATKAMGDIDIYTRKTPFGKEPHESLLFKSVVKMNRLMSEISQKDYLGISPQTELNIAQDEADATFKTIEESLSYSRVGDNDLLHAIGSLYRSSVLTVALASDHEVAALEAWLEEMEAINDTDATHPETAQRKLRLEYDERNLGLECENTKFIKQALELRSRLQSHLLPEINQRREAKGLPPLELCTIERVIKLSNQGYYTAIHKTDLESINAIKEGLFSSTESAIISSHLDNRTSYYVDQKRRHSTKNLVLRTDAFFEKMANGEQNFLPLTEDDKLFYQDISETIHLIISLMGWMSKNMDIRHYRELLSDIKNLALSNEQHSHRSAYSMLAHLKQVERRQIHTSSPLIFDADNHLPITLAMAFREEIGTQVLRPTPVMPKSLQEHVMTYEFDQLIRAYTPEYYLEQWLAPAGFETDQEEPLSASATHTLFMISATVGYLCHHMGSYSLGYFKASELCHLIPRSPITREATRRAVYFRAQARMSSHLEALPDLSTENGVQALMARKQAAAPAVVAFQDKNGLVDSVYNGSQKPLGARISKAFNIPRLSLGVHKRHELERICDTFTLMTSEKPCLAHDCQRLNSAPEQPHTAIAFTQSLKKYFNSLKRACEEGNIAWVAGADLARKDEALKHLLRHLLTPNSKPAHTLKRCLMIAGVKDYMDAVGSTPLFIDFSANQDDRKPGEAIHLWRHEDEMSGKCTWLLFVHVSASIQKTLNRAFDAPRKVLAWLALTQPKRLAQILRQHQSERGEDVEKFIEAVVNAPASVLGSIPSLTTLSQLLRGDMGSIDSPDDNIRVLIMTAHSSTSRGYSFTIAHNPNTPNTVEALVNDRPRDARKDADAIFLLRDPFYSMAHPYFKPLTERPKHLPDSEKAAIDKENRYAIRKNLEAQNANANRFFGHLALENEKEDNALSPHLAELWQLYPQNSVGSTYHDFINQQHAICITTDTMQHTGRGERTLAQQKQTIFVHEELLGNIAKAIPQLYPQGLASADAISYLSILSHALFNAAHQHVEQRIIRFTHDEQHDAFMDSYQSSWLFACGDDGTDGKATFLRKIRQTKRKLYEAIDTKDHDTEAALRQEMTVIAAAWGVLFSSDWVFHPEHHDEALLNKAEVLEAAGDKALARVLRNASSMMWAPITLSNEQQCGQVMLQAPILAFTERYHVDGNMKLSVTTRKSDHGDAIKSNNLYDYREKIAQLPHELDVGLPSEWKARMQDALDSRTPYLRRDTAHSPITHVLWPHCEADYLGALGEWLAHQWLSTLIKHSTQQWGENLSIELLDVHKTAELFEEYDAFLAIRRADSLPILLAVDAKFYSASSSYRQKDSVYDKAIVKEKALTRWCERNGYSPSPLAIYLQTRPQGLSTGSGHGAAPAPLKRDGVVVRNTFTAPASYQIDTLDPSLIASHEAVYQRQAVVNTEAMDWICRRALKQGA